MNIRVAVLGAGTMGAGIAAVFAAAGHSVSVFTRSEKTLQSAKSILGGLDVELTTSLAECVAGANLVCESVVESLAVKKEIFATLEALAPAGCLLTTNTSSVPISAIAKDLKKPDRVVGLHWFNPPQVMPLVEIVRGERTADEVVDRTRDLCAAIGKRVIEVNQDVPGFVVNRLQYALFREAVHLVEEGIASIEDVDEAVASTLAPRWSACGPLKLMDMAGLDTVENVSKVIMPALNNSTGVPSSVADRVSKGAAGTKSGSGFYEWTDESIAAAVDFRNSTVTLLSERDLQ